MTTKASVEKKSRMADVKRDFDHYTKEHVITHLEEGGVMRHMVVQKPGTWMHGYVITTWPNYLCISGDLGCYVFSRLEDMFEFFRSPDGAINPGYWSEKVMAADRHGVEEFDIAVLRANIAEYFEDEEGDEGNLVPNPTRVKALAAIEHLGSQPHEEHEAIEALMGVIPDAYEFSRHQWRSQFLWCLYAIVHAIKLYDARLVEVAA